MARFDAVIATLGGLAVVLSGCGGSGGDKTAHADFVSQSVEGTVVLSPDIDGKDPAGGHLDGTLKMWIDADKMAMRLELVMPNAKVDNYTTVNGTAMVIVDGTAKSVTLYNSTFVNGTKLLGPVCRTMMVAEMPDPAIMKSLIKARLEQYKPTGTEDGLRKFDATYTQDEGTVNGEVVLEDSNALHKMDVNFKGAAVGHEGSGHFVFSATKAQAGTPDQSVFTVPKSWGDCVNSTDDEVGTAQYFGMVEAAMQLKSKAVDTAVVAHEKLAAVVV